MLVTDRMRPLRMQDGRTVHQVGLPYHWGTRGLTTGDSANDLAHDRARPERPHPGGEGVHLRHPARPPAARRRRCRASSPSCASRRTRRREQDPRVEPEEASRRDRRWREPPAPGRLAEAYGDDAKERVGFFTDTSGLHRLQGLRGRVQGVEPDPGGRARLDGRVVRQHRRSSARTRGATSPSSSRRKPLRVDGETASDGAVDADGEALRWLMESDVCKHCTHAACLDVCPTGALFRTEFGTVVVQEDICNGCGYCVPACPFGVLDKRTSRRLPPPTCRALLGRKEDGRVWKCTLCYDRLKGGHEPACAKACPTDSIQFGPLDELRERADERLAKLEAEGWNGAQLYGRDPDDGVGGFGAFFLLLDEPEVYGLPPDPVVTTRDLPEMWATRSRPPARCSPASPRALLGGSMSGSERPPRDGRRRTAAGSTPSPRDALVLRPADHQGAGLDVGDPAYFFTGGLAGASAVLALAARLTGNEQLSRRPRSTSAPRPDLVSPRAADLRPRPARALP